MVLILWGCRSAEVQVSSKQNSPKRKESQSSRFPSPAVHPDFPVLGQPPGRMRLISQKQSEFHTVTVQPGILVSKMPHLDILDWLTRHTGNERSLRIHAGKCLIPDRAFPQTVKYALKCEWIAFPDACGSQTQFEGVPIPSHAVIQRALPRFSRIFSIKTRKHCSISKFSRQGVLLTKKRLPLGNRGEERVPLVSRKAGNIDFFS